MFPFFIGVNEKFVNLNAVALIEDETPEGDDAESVALITTSDGFEVKLLGEDADLLFERADLIAKANDAVVQKIIDAAGGLLPQGASQ